MERGNFQVYSLAVTIFECQFTTSIESTTKRCGHDLRVACPLGAYHEGEMSPYVVQVALVTNCAGALRGDEGADCAAITASVRVLGTLHHTGGLLVALRCVRFQEGTQRPEEPLETEMSPKKQYNDYTHHIYNGGMFK